MLTLIPKAGTEIDHKRFKLVVAILNTMDADPYPYDEFGPHAETHGFTETLKEQIREDEDNLLPDDIPAYEFLQLQRREMSA